MDGGDRVLLLLAWFIKVKVVVNDTMNQTVDKRNLTVYNLVLPALPGKLERCADRPM